MLRYLGMALSPLFAPLGFGDWHTTVAVLAGLIAKENCVGTLRITFGNATAAGFMATLRETYSPIAGYSFLVFNLLCAPCFAAIGTMYKEFGDTKWTLRAVAYQTALAYIVAMLIYQGYQVIIGQGDWFNELLTGVATAVIGYGLLIKKDQNEDLNNLPADIQEGASK